MPAFRDRAEQRTVELSVEFLGRETDKAYLVYDGTKNCWVPFSVTEERHGNLKGGPGIIVIHEWFAKKEGLI